MLIDINQLRERRQPLVIESDFGAGQLELRSNILTLKPPAHSYLKLSLYGEHLVVVGTVDAELEVTCCRCLKPFGRAIRKPFELDYQPDPEVGAESEEFGLTYGDLSVGFYRNDQLDVAALISEQIVLEIPMKPVCREGCKGLCDQCGADLNQSSCSCVREHLDPRLAALLDLKRRLK